MTYVQEKFNRLKTIIKRTVPCDIMYSEYADYYEVHIMFKDEIKCVSFILEKSHLVCYSYNCIMKEVRERIGIDEDESDY